MVNSKSIRVSTDKQQIKKVSSEILNALKKYKLDEGVLFDIRLSTEEALRNAMEHGNKGKVAQPVDITYTLSPQALEITIEDRGSGFDYKNLPNTTSDENILKTTGRGIYLIRSLMDEVHFNDIGNKIRMVKYLSLPAGRKGGRR